MHSAKMYMLLAFNMLSLGIQKSLFYRVLHEPLVCFIGGVEVNMRFGSGIEVIEGI